MKRDNSFTREFAFDRAKIDKSKRELELSFSSEEPVERWFGMEILDHSEGAIDMSRLNGNSAPLLWNHDTNVLIGSVRKAWTEEGKARAVVRFGNSQRAKETWADVEDGTISTVSVGYRVNKLVSEGKDDAGMKIMRATSWMPYEISLVAVPADVSVGVGRAANADKEIEVMETKEIELTRADSPGNQRETMRRQEILALGEQFGKEDPDIKDLCLRAALTGADPADVKRGILTLMKATPIITSGDIGMTREQIKNWSLVRALNCLANKKPVDGLEREASDAVAKLCRRDATGFFIPNEIVHGHRDLSAGTGNAGGYTIQTDVLGQSLIQLLRNRAVTYELGAMQLGGLVGNVAVPSQTGAATAYWVPENGKTPGSNLLFGQLGLTPHRLSAVTVLGKQLLAQTSVDVEGLVRNDFALTLAIAIDLAALSGNGANSQPLGILNTTGIGSVNFGAAATWAKILDFETQVSNANALGGSMAYVATPNTRAKLKAAPKIGATFPNFIWENMLAPNGRGDGVMNGYRALVTKQVPGDKLIFGNWNDLILADWIGMDVTMDPYTLADQHQVKVTINMLADCGIRHAGSFTVSADSAAQ